MRIAVCDDEKEQTDGNVRLILKWAEKREITVNIDVFSSAEEFLFRWSEGHPYDLAILDIKMKVMTGMELAKVIRKTDQDLQILFITGVTSHVLEGYEVAALNYLIKPYMPTQFVKCLDKAYAAFRKKEVEALLVSQEGRFIRVPFSEIMYMEISGHYFEIYTVSMGKYRMKKQMNEMLPLLNKYLFIRCHRSFIVNVIHIASLARQEIKLKSGQVVPLSMPNVQAVTQLFLEYHYKQNDEGGLT